MGSVAQLQQQLGGFDFSLHERNVNLLKKAEAARVAARECSQGSSQGGVSASGVPAGLRLPPLRKTGTTICGVIFNGGVVLGADTRATQGSVIADKNCSKLHKIHNNIFAAGAGTSADLDHTTHWLSAQVELHRLNTRSKVRELWRSLSVPRIPSPSSPARRLGVSLNVRGVSADSSREHGGVCVESETLSVPGKRRRRDCCISDFPPFSSERPPAARRPAAERRRSKE